ncbi:MAG: hypothetical protein OXE81_09860 [Gammaproteobacteria bacterium]|nr:hypothetical protein [Gammaproteobacteria bacterium]
MCAILDANVTSEVFGKEQSHAGQKFRDWLKTGNSFLVMGGKLADELTHDHRFREWSIQAIQYGKLRLFDRGEVEKRTDELQRSDVCRSDDAHVIALAQISGARLLFSNEPDLHKDFKSKHLIDGPRGKVYSTKDSKAFTKAHKTLLADRSLCKAYL